MLTECDATMPALFAALPGLAGRLPRVALGRWPTPIEAAPRFAAAAGLEALYVKREDLSHPDSGGSKVRGLEFLLADALRRGARTVLTVGAAGSHHVARTAWHARRLGLEVVAVVVRQPNAEYVARNVAHALGAGAKIVPATVAGVGPRLVAEWLRAVQHGARPAWIPPGGTTPIACAGHVSAAFELRDAVRAGRVPEPDRLFVALGSVGTAAGLALGCRLAGLRTRVVGVVASYRWYATAGRTARMARRTLKLLRGCDAAVPAVTVGADDLDVEPGALGPGYARFTDEARAAARRMYDTQGLALDGTYTGKTLAGMLRYIAARRLERGVHLLWLTYQRPAAADGPVETPPALRRWLSDPPQKWLHSSLAAV